MRLGVFGGTFDPVHLGHLILAGETCWQLQMDRVLWVLTPTPPHKPDQAVVSFHYRFEMLQAAISDNPYFHLCRVDIDRSPPHYAVDTMHLLRERYPLDELIYIMGGDSLRDLPTWYNPLGFLGACDAIGVIRRPGAVINLSELEQALPGVTSKVRFVDAPLLEISATEIRRRISHGLPFQYYLPYAVYHFVREYGLYRKNQKA